MREHMLISIIAMVGFYGLFTIYLDMRQQPRHNKWPIHQTLYRPSGDDQLMVAKLPTLTRHRDSTSRMDIHISNFDPAESYFVDLGDGVRTKLIRPVTTHHVSQSGDHVIKIFKNDQLIDSSYSVSIL